MKPEAFAKLKYMTSWYTTHELQEINTGLGHFTSQDLGRSKSKTTSMSWFHNTTSTAFSHEKNKSNVSSQYKKTDYIYEGGKAMTRMNLLAQ